MQDTRLETHAMRLREQWGPPEPLSRIGEIEGKPDEDIERWETHCRARATYALGRANGDGFWEAKVEWYGARANWLKMYRTSPVERHALGLKRKLSAPGIVPMNPYPKRRCTSPPSFEVTVGGWPSGNPPSPCGPTPSGLPIGEKEVTSSPLVNPSPPPSSQELEVDPLLIN